MTTGEQRLEALRAELDRQRAETIQAHWSAFDTALAAENLDEAADILAQIRDLNPEEPGLPQGEQHLMEAQAELEQKRQEALKIRISRREIVSISRRHLPYGGFEW